MIPMLGLQCHSNNLSLQHDYGNMVLENHAILDPMKISINVEVFSHKMHKIESCYEARCTHFANNNKEYTDPFPEVFSHYSARFST